MSFAATARSTDDDRFVLNHILVERDEENDLITRIVATDGKRLHVHAYDAGLFDNDICEEMIEPGLYEVVAISKKFLVICEPDAKDMTYPNWRAIVPKDFPKAAWKRDVVQEQTTSKICMLTGALFATDFLIEACGLGLSKTKDMPITYGQESPTSALVITHELGKAILMPMSFAKAESDEKSATAALPNVPEPEPQADQLL
jgi:hypothetical protein